MTNRHEIAPGGKIYKYIVFYAMFSREKADSCTAYRNVVSDVKLEGEAAIQRLQAGLKAAEGATALYINGLIYVGERYV
jgi:hypothetical protein